MCPQELDHHFPHYVCVTKCSSYCHALMGPCNGQKLPVLGQMNVTVEYEDQQAQLPVLIVLGDGPALWSRSWLSAICLNWPSIKHISQGVESILFWYPDLFKEEFGTLKGMEIKLSIAKDAIPQFKKPCPVPYAVCGVVEQDLERLENLGVIEKCKFSHSLSPFPSQTGMYASVAITKSPSTLC